MNKNNNDKDKYKYNTNCNIKNKIYKKNKKNRYSKNKKILLAIIIIVFVIINIKFIFDSNKTVKNGNNKSIKEIEEKILNIDSYKANIEVTIKSNKNENFYNIEQIVNKDSDYQIVKGPETIKGMEIKYENGKMEIKNTELNVGKIFENYPYLSSNYLFLTDFIKTYKNIDEKYKKIEINESNEQDKSIIMECTNIDGNNKYNQIQKLYLNRKTIKPEKMEIYDINKNLRAYILYNEIEFNI